MKKSGRKLSSGFFPLDNFGGRFYIEITFDNHRALIDLSQAVASGLAAGTHFSARGRGSLREDMFGGKEVKVEGKAEPYPLKVSFTFRLTRG